MGKSNIAEKTADVAEVVEVVEVAPVLTIVKDEVEAPRKLTLDERIQRVEDLSLLIDRWKTALLLSGNYSPYLSHRFTDY